MSKTYFGLLDSRNSKYQGVIKEDSFNGIGMLMDDQLTTVLSSWEKNSLRGPSVIIFKDMQTFFGEIEDNIPKGVVCIQSNKKEKFVLKFQSNKSSQVSALALVSSNQQITHFQKEPQTEEYKVVDFFNIKNQDEELKILTNIFRLPIRKEQVDLEEYLIKMFVQPMQLFELSGGNQPFFGFKNTASLGFKLSNNCPTALGYFNLFPRNLLFGRKINQNSLFPQKTKIQQGHFEEPSKSFSWLKEKGPSAECIKLTEEYFKKSTTFRNQFVNLEHVNKIFNKVKSIEEKVMTETGKRYGQALLQKDYGSSHDKDLQVFVKQYTLQQVREEIYKAAGKKQNTSRSIHKSPIVQSMKKSPENAYNNSIRAYGGQSYRINEFKLNSPMYDYLDSCLIEKRVVEKEVENRMYQQSNFNKVQLLKSVDQILKAQKQQETALLNYLIRDKEVAISNRKQIGIQNDSNISSAQRKYHKYQPKYTPNKYQPKINPFNIHSSNQKQQGNTKRRVSYLEEEQNTKRRVSYLQEQQNPPGTLALPSKSPYDLLRSETQARRGIQIDPFAYGVEESQNKSYGNLAKYKQRPRQSAPAQQATNKRANRYLYFKQKDEDLQDDEIRDTQTLMNQLKLFDLEKQNQDNLSLLRSYQERKTQYYERSHQPIEKKSRPQDHLYEKTNYLHPRQTLRELKHSETGSHLTKLFTFEDPNKLALQENYPDANGSTTNKKLRRTFHYVD